MGSVYKIIPLLIESEFSYSTLNLDGKYVTRIKFDHISNTDIDGLKKKLLVAKKNSNLKSYAFKDIKLEYYKLI
jgi:hypothetical protein